MPRVIHFEIMADEPERAVKFYSDVFGWEIQNWGPVEYWLITTGPENEPGINGAIARRVPERSATVNTVDVPDADAFMKKIAAGGGKVLTPKMAVPGVGYMAYCEDTEGNAFSIMQQDENAA